MPEYKCGCKNERHAPGVLRCVRKCDHHVEFSRSQPAGEAYYRLLGAIKEDGSPDGDKYVREMLEAVGPIPPAEPPWRDDEMDLVQPTAAEIGCGASPYVRAITGAGYKYVGLDPDPWACRWVRDTYGEYAHVGSYPVEGLGVREESFLSLVFSAHALEHMADAPAAVARMFRDLRPGGHLRLILPDDADQTAPDHLWFFTLEGLISTVAGAGFSDVRGVQRQVVPKEKFLYVSARKPPQVSV